MVHDELKDKIFSSWAWERINKDIEYYIIDTDANCWVSHDMGETYSKIGTFIWGCQMGGER